MYMLCVQTHASWKFCTCTKTATMNNRTNTYNIATFNHECRLFSYMYVLVRFQTFTVWQGPKCLHKTLKAKTHVIMTPVHHPITIVTASKNPNPFGLLSWSLLYHVLSRRHQAVLSLLGQVLLPSCFDGIFCRYMYIYIQKS